MECLVWQDEPLLTRDEERALGLRVRDHGDRAAAEELFRRSIRLAIRESNRSRIPHGESRDDLHQSHLWGLWVAAQRFDPDLGRFSTVACMWMRKYRTTFMHAAGLIHIPAHVRTCRNRENRGDPIAEWQRKLLAAWKRIKIFQDCYLPDGGNGIDNAPSNEDTCDQTETHDELAAMRAALNRLPDRDRFVISQRFLEGKTLQDIAIQLGITYQSVQHIQRHAMKRLRRIMRVDAPLTGG